MNKEELFACLEKAGEVFAKQQPEAVAEEEELDLEAQMQEEELAALVAKELGLL